MQARFSLQGELLAPDVDLPTHLGLHHHGEEAEVRHGAQGGLGSSRQVEKDLWSVALDLLCTLFQFSALVSIGYWAQNVSPHSFTFQSVA